MNTVLIVEDDATLRRALCRGLSGSFTVIEAGSCAEALALLRGGAVIDVIVCDHDLRDGHFGDEVLGAADARGVGRVRILMSGRPWPPQGSPLHWIYLRKPFEVKALGALIAERLATA